VGNKHLDILLPNDSSTVVVNFVFVNFFCINIWATSLVERICFSSSPP